MNTLLATIKSTSGTKDGAGSFEAVLSIPTVDRDKEIVDAKAFDPLPDHITIDVDHAMTVEKTIGSGTPYYDGALLKFKGTYASHPLAQMVRSLVDEGHIRTMSVAYMDSVYEVDEKDGLRHLRSGELLNAGIVGIPSNRQALITASKSLIGDVLEATKQANGGYVVGELGPENFIPSTQNFTVNPNIIAHGTVKSDRDLTKAIYDSIVDGQRRGADSKAGARHSSHDLSLLQSAHDALVAVGAICEAKTSPTGDGTPTDTPEKAAEAADVKSPAEPAGPSVEVERARIELLLAEAALA